MFARRWGVAIALALNAYLGCSTQTQSPHRAPPAAPERLPPVRWLGRHVTVHAQHEAFAWSGAGFVARFVGTGLRARLSNEGAYLFHLFVDDSPPVPLTAQFGDVLYPLVTQLPPGEHTVRVVRQTEGIFGNSELLSLQVTDGTLLPPGPAPTRHIEVIGDSISAGYGSLGMSAHCHFSFATESHTHSYAAVAARLLSAELSTLAVSGHGVARNLDRTTTDTLPMLYDRALTNEPRYPWSFTPKPQAVIIHLGTNDFALGDPGFAFEDEYLALIERIRRSVPEALIVCALGPLFAETDPRLARLRERLAHVIAARATLGDAHLTRLEFAPAHAGDFGCDYHPNVEKHHTMGQALAEHLRAQLNW